MGYSMTATERLTIQKVKTELDTHLHDHDIKLDPKLHDVYHAVFGEKGKGGVIADVERLEMAMASIDERLETIESGINKVLWIVVAAVLAAVLKLVIIG